MLATHRPAAVQSRLSQEHSIASTLLLQPRPALQVLTSFVVLGGRAPVVHCARTLDDSGVAGDHLDPFRAWLSRLEQHGLAWVDDDDIAQTAPGVGAVLAVPAEWGAPARTLLESISKDALNPP